MVARNDITGDAIQSRMAAKEYAEKFDKVDWKGDLEKPKAFQVLQCPYCHIKVSTANGKCPCCERDLV